MAAEADAEHAREVSARRELNDLVLRILSDLELIEPDASEVAASVAGGLSRALSVEGVEAMLRSQRDVWVHEFATDVTNDDFKRGAVELWKLTRTDKSPGT